jgi:hypothetical protein
MKVKTYAIAQHGGYGEESEMMEAIKYDLQTKDFIDEGVYADISKNGFPFGSAVYGGFIQGQSDYDIAVHPVCNPLFDDLISNNQCVYVAGDYVEEHFRSMYCKKQGFSALFNFLFFWNEENYEDYRRATNAMKSIALSGSFSKELKDKKFRVNMFEYFLSLC